MGLGCEAAPADGRETAFYARIGAYGVYHAFRLGKTPGWTLKGSRDEVDQIMRQVRVGSVRRGV